MEPLIRNQYLRALIFFIWVTSTLMKEGLIKQVSAQGQSSLTCDENTTETFGYRCDVNGLQNQCSTFMLFYANSYYLSLSNLSFYFGFNRTAIAEVSGLPIDREFVPRNQPLLIPIDCRCNGSVFLAEATKTVIEGETFYEIAASLEGLTSCEAIIEKNPNLSPWNLDEDQVLVPLICACPTVVQLTQGVQFLLSYPTYKGDTFSSLASLFNTTVEAMVSTNNGSPAFPSDILPVNSTILIPLTQRPILSRLLKAHGLNLAFNDTSIPAMNVSKNHSRRATVHDFRIYIGLSGVILGLSVAMAGTILVIQWRKKSDLGEAGDVELQQLNEKNTRELKEVLEDPQDPFNDQNLVYTPHKVGVDTYTIEELRRATDDFNSSNHIEGSVFHGRLNGKNLAIKQANAETMSKIEFELFHDTQHHPNIVWLLGTCTSDDCDSYLVYEYVRNGSLKDWLHGGLAMKSQFIDSCYCFLTWSQRLRICLHVAMGLHYMHHTMVPSYVHRNIKSRNILLDEEFNAKIANFGMAKCCEDDLEEPQLSWSRGYLAPEYVEHGTIAPSIDIFAYGVVLLEVISGQPPITKPNNKGENTPFSKKINSLLQPDGAEELRNWMDSTLGEAYSFEVAIALANLAGACVQEDPSSRPSAEELVEKLAKLVDKLPEVDTISSCESSSKPK
ncbi:protein kinase superfamily protein [Tasmannia lanceolata]|uniref:protein kinase superfamily protein n=1 Tax=Tasmannia lanceolata TaxID=3420 RepID=UPI0040644441